QGQRPRRRHRRAPQAGLGPARDARAGRHPRGPPRGRQRRRPRHHHPRDFEEGGSDLSVAIQQPTEAPAPAKNARVLITDDQTLTTFEADNHGIQALKAGASGYVLKDSQPGAIVSSILAVVAGERVMAGAVANRVLEMLTGATTPKEFYDGLTAREVEILKMLATGMANKQIAYRLKISEKTVRNHVSNMYEKLDIYDRAQAVLYAVRKGLVEI